jgi:hypothetical protein
VVPFTETERDIMMQLKKRTCKFLIFDKRNSLSIYLFFY